MHRKDKYRYFPINDEVSVPIPINATPAEEAQVVAEFRAKYPPEKLAAEVAEWKQILQDHEEGKLIDADVLLEELERNSLEAIQPDHLIGPSE